MDELENKNAEVDALRDKVKELEEKIEWFKKQMDMEEGLLESIQRETYMQLFSAMLSDRHHENNIDYYAELADAALEEINKREAKGKFKKPKDKGSDEGNGEE